MSLPASFLVCPATLIAGRRMQWIEHFVMSATKQLVAAQTLNQPLVLSAPCEKLEDDSIKLKE